ncbi:MAG: DUF7218 family protein [Desulfovibrionales bacterium]
MAKDHGPTIKDDEQYEALRRKGVSKEKAARIANTQRSKAGTKGGHADEYEDRTKEELFDRAKELGLDVKKNMRKSEIIDILRNH